MLKQFLLSIPLLGIFSCTSPKNIDYSTAFKGNYDFPVLDLNGKYDEEPLSNIEKSYILKDYGSIVRSSFSDSLTTQDQYLYLKSLLNLNEWDKLYILFKNTALGYSDPMIGVYLEEIALQTFIYQKDIIRADSIYNLLLKQEQQYPLDDTKKVSIQNRYAAFKGNSDLAASLGGYYFYRYDQNKKDLKSFYLALVHKNSDALALAHFKEFKNAIAKKSWKSFLPFLQLYNNALYLEVLKNIGAYNTLTAYYFNKSQYSNVLKYAPKDSFYYHASKLMAKESKNVDTSLIYAANHVHSMFPYAANYYYNQHNFKALYNLFQKDYAPNSLRLFIVLGLNKAQYSLVYSILEKLIHSSPSTLSPEDTAMSLYWLGFLSHRLGKNNDAIEFYQKAAIHYPNYYYGWESFRSLESSQVTDIFSSWDTLYKLKYNQIESYVDKVNNFELDPNNMDLKRSLFFFKVREDKKAKKYLELYLSSLNQAKPLAYYAIALELYANHRMDYFYFYTRAFMKNLTSQIGHYLFFKDFLPLLYPRKYTDFIEQASEYYGFKSSILESLILQESTYDFLALSWVGAQGLSQLMPKTAQPILKKLSKNKLLENNDIFDPKTNILVGADYLNWLMHRVYKDYPTEDALALSYASYNAGPKRIKQMYHRMENRVNLAHFIESIDFTESRNYVKKLIFAKDIYEFLYH